MRPDVARRQVAAVCAHPPPERGTPGSLDTHPAADPEPVAWSLLESHFQPVLLAARLVDEQANGTVVVGEDDIDVAVVVDVAKRGATTDLGTREHWPARRAGVFEAASFQVVKQL